jgi:cytochrome c5
MGTTLRWWIVAALAMLLVACGGRDSGIQAAETRSTGSASVDPPDRSPPVYDLKRGEMVFSANCLRCHGEGLYNAPRVGNAADWEPRLRQPLATLVEHAVYGHGGMPPKGGFAALSNNDVRNAVAYVVDRSKKIILALERQQHRQDCHPVRAPEKCEAMDAEDVLTLQMLWLLGAPGKQ